MSFIFFISAQAKLHIQVFDIYLICLTRKIIISYLYKGFWDAICFPLVSIFISVVVGCFFMNCVDYVMCIYVSLNIKLLYKRICFVTYTYSKRVTIPD